MNSLQDAFDGAINSHERPPLLQEEEEESALVLQIIRDNLTAWSSVFEFDEDVAGLP